MPRPHLVDAQVGSALRRLARAGQLPPEQAHAALMAVDTVVDVRYAHAGVLSKHAWSGRDTLTFYDALYVALAAALGCPLLTGDGRLSRAPRLACAVELVG